MDIALQRIKGAVSTKDMQPILTHVRLYSDGHIAGTNGRVTIYTAAEVPAIDCVVPHRQFDSAATACDHEPNLALDGDRLHVTGERFTAYLPTLPVVEWPEALHPTDNSWELGLGSFIATLKQAVQFVATDATRPWACGVHLVDGHAYSTNNTSIVRVPVEWGDDPLGLPTVAVDELIRLGEEPEEIHWNDHVARFVYSWGYLQTVLLSEAAPDLSRFFPVEMTEAALYAPHHLLAALEHAVAFVQDELAPVVFLKDNEVRTVLQDTQDGARIQCDTGSGTSAFRVETLARALGVATAVDLSDYPNPCGFINEDTHLEGRLMGVALS